MIFLVTALIASSKVETVEPVTQDEIMHFSNVFNHWHELMIHLYGE
jgi:hypothetical protein